MKINHQLVMVYIFRLRAGAWEFLQLKREPACYMGNTWQTCTGGIEADETAIDAAVREVCEETSLRPVEMYRMGSAIHFYTEAHDTMWIAPGFCVVVDPEAKVTLNHEHTEFRWLPIEQAERELMWPSDRWAVKHIRREIFENGPAKAYLRVKLP